MSTIADQYQSSPLVLVVEDDESTRILLRRAMEQEGYQVAVADTEQGLAAYTRLRPDIVLLDAQVPVSDGCSCRSQLKTLCLDNHTPVLMLVGIEEQVEPAFFVGITDYITKPLHLAVLRQRVQRLLEQSRLYKQLKKTNQELQAGISQIKQSERALQQREEQLLHDAFHDQLTGLPNRVLFINRLEHAILYAKRNEDYLFAVLFLDLDRFKVVNYSLGHAIGDQLLQAIANRLQACVRPGDTVARLGGDEFTILLENIHDLKDATQVADCIQKQLTLPFNLNGNEVFTAASIGIALNTPDYERSEELLRDADTTMYRAKLLGKGRYEVFDKTMHIQAMALLQLENDLRRAIERLEFRLHYQPIVSLKSNRVTGFEALVRWQHPERGLVSPAEFIPVAEETGLIIPIGTWVLREACRQMRAWQVQFPVHSPLTMSVNLSGKQFSQPDLIDQIKQILHETGLDPRSLKLEITESVLMENAESAVAMIVQLQNLGIRLSMDDFGTGYSSLSYLHRFPIDTLKIDRSFVNDVDVDAEKIEIISTVVALAWNLGMDVVAEGVETKKQMYQLRALKCEFGQGYFFSRPLDSDKAGALIAAEPQRIAI